MDDSKHTTAAGRLATALTEVGAPPEMIRQATEGYYGDFTSPLAFPITTLVGRLKSLGLDALARRAMEGEFDGD